MLWLVPHVLRRDAVFTSHVTWCTPSSLTLPAPWVTSGNVTADFSSRAKNGQNLFFTRNWPWLSQKHCQGHPRTPTLHSGEWYLEPALAAECSYLTNEASAELTSFKTFTEVWGSFFAQLTKVKCINLKSTSQEIFIWVYTSVTTTQTTIHFQVSHKLPSCLFPYSHLWTSYMLLNSSSWVWEGSTPVILVAPEVKSQAF